MGKGNKLSREKLSSALDELKKLKASLQNDGSKIYNDDASQKVVSQINDTLDSNNSLYKEIVKVDEEIKLCRKELPKHIKGLEELEKRVEAALKEREEMFNSSAKLLSEEEIKTLREKYSESQLSAIEACNEYKRNINKTKRKLSALIVKKADLIKASKLGVSYEEYQDLSSTLRKKKIYESIYSKLGIYGLVSNKNKTKDVKEKLKKAKEEILSTVSDYSKKYKTNAVDLIQSLFTLDDKMDSVKSSKQATLKNEEFNNLKLNSDILPAKVKDFGVARKNAYKPDAAPEDMKDLVDDSLKFDNLSQFENDNNSQLNNTVKTINIDDYDASVKVDNHIDKSVIDDELDKLKNNDKESGYNMSQEEIRTLSGENKDQIYSLDRKENESREEYFERLTSAYDSEYPVEEVRKEYIPGSNVLKPRNRRIDETEEQYQEYIDSYYNEHADDFKNESLSDEVDTIEEFVETPQTVIEEEVIASAPKTVIEEEVIANAPKTVIEEEVIANTPKTVIEEEVIANAPKTVIEEEVIANPPKTVIEEEVIANAPKTVIEEEVIAGAPKTVIEEEVISKPYEKTKTKDEKNIHNEADAKIKDIADILNGNNPLYRIGMKDISNDFKVTDTDVKVNFENRSNEEEVKTDEVAETEVKVDFENTNNDELENKVTDTDVKVDFENRSNEEEVKTDEVAETEVKVNFENTNNDELENKVTDTDVKVNFENRSNEEKVKTDEVAETEVKVDFENTNNDELVNKVTDTDVKVNFESNSDRVFDFDNTDFEFDFDDTDFDFDFGREVKVDDVADTDVEVNFENRSSDEEVANDEAVDTDVEVSFENRSNDTDEVNNTNSTTSTSLIVSPTNKITDGDQIVIDQPIIKEKDSLKYETINVLENEEKDVFYVRRYTVERFGLHSASHPARVEGALYYRISRDDYDKLMVNSENDDYIAPYKVVHQTYHINTEVNNLNEVDKKINDIADILNGNNPLFRIGMNEDNNSNTNNNTDVDTDIDLDEIVENNDNKENVDVKDNKNDELPTVVTLFREINDNSIYASADFLDEFNISPIPGTEIDVEGEHAFKINDADYQNFVNYVNYSNEHGDDKIIINYQDINLKKKKDVDTNDNKDSNVIELKLFRDLDNNGQIYSPISVLDSLGIFAADDPIDVNGVPSIKISKMANDKINELANKSSNPKYEVKYVDVHLKNKKNDVVDTNDNKVARPHVESIIYKLTEGLDIRAKDGKRFMASNIHVSKKFKEELNSGNYLYNIVSFTRKLISLPVNCFRKLTSKIFLGARGKRVMTELNDRLDNLSDIELEVLFDEYRGSQLKTDMNNQINPLILERLKRFGLDKVTKLNDKIGKNYAKLFSLLKEIDALDEQFATGRLTDDEKKPMLDARSTFFADAANCIREIEADRKTANNLLSGGIHGLEEDFKAVATKLSYVGMRFAKTNNFDNELQANLASSGQKLRNAMAHDDDEGIVESFLELESEYSKNTNIKKVSLTGSKSVGSKYYTPLAERFDYRDDPFIKDLFTTVAIATSVYSAINAYKVHQIEQQQALHEEQSRAASVNEYNDNVMNEVHNAGKGIEAHRNDFSEGMKAQTYDASLNTSGMYERGNLDATNWSFSDAYHAADHQAHIDFNAMHDQAVNDIQNTITGYSNGSLTQAQALQQMSDVANHTHQNFINTATQYKEICENYAASHPQFDLHAFNESIDYLVNNSNAISNMNQAMVDVSDMGTVLSNLNNSHMETLSHLPSDMYSSLLAAYATCCYAEQIAAGMKNAKKTKYGNDITKMMSDYVSENYNEESTSRRR